MNAEKEMSCLTTGAEVVRSVSDVMTMVMAVRAVSVVMNTV